MPLQIVRKNAYRIVFVFAFLMVGLLSSGVLAKSEVVFWSNHRLEDEEAFRQLIDSFEMAHPNIEIVWENQVDGGDTDYYGKLTVAILGGVAPDVFYVRPGSDAIFVKNGWVYDIDSLVSRDADELAVDDFIPAQVSELKFEGKWWALPFDFSAIGVYYNQDLFDAAALTYPTMGATWTDIIDAARKLTRRTGDVVSQWGFHGMQWYFSQWAEGFIMSFGGELFNEDYTEPVIAGNEGAIFGLELPARLINDLEVAAPFNASNYGALFSSGQAAMTMDGSWAATTHRLLNDFRFDVTALPYGSEGLTVSATGGAWAMAADASDVDAAWQWMKTLASHEASRKLIVDPVRSLPPRVSLMSEWAEAVQYAGSPASAFLLADQVVRFGRAIPQTGFQYHAALGAYRDSLVYGHMSPAEVAEQIQVEWNAEFSRLQRETEVIE